MKEGGALFVDITPLEICPKCPTKKFEKKTQWR